MKKLFAITIIVYFTVALAIMLVAFLSRGESWPPMIFALTLLIPLYLWVKDYSGRIKLSDKVDKKSIGVVAGWALMLFLLALLVRIPSVLMFNMPYEKTPLIYLLTLTIVLVEKKELSVFGFKTHRMIKALLYGVVYFAILQGTILLVHCFMVYFIMNQMVFSSFDVAFFLLSMPFQTLLVGVSEEGLFRGYIQTSIEQFGVLKAVLFQAALFGLWHFVWNLSPFNLYGMLRYITITFLFGLLFGYFYAKTRNLVPLILVHGLWNSFQSGIITNTEVLDKLAQATFLTQFSAWFLPYIIAVPAVLAFTKYCVKEI
ncbi:MAG: CPBP family intramembrane glutamic endopeptidase [Candidatus Bathyarchaeia archaeon]